MLIFAAVRTTTDARADLVLETETSQLGEKGTGNISVALQFERDRNGSERLFTLNQFEYAITDDVEILVEPFFYEWDRPAGGGNFEGVGDLEITPSFRFIHEDRWKPDVLAAFKLKVPTADNRDIGTGKFDYQPYFIVGKTCGPWTFNLNLGADFVTSPSGESLRNQAIYDFSVERKIGCKWSVFAEIFGNSSPAPGEASTFAGAIAAEYELNDHSNVFVSFGYDTDQTANVRFGFNFEF